MLLDDCPMEWCEPIVLLKVDGKSSVKQLSHGFDIAGPCSHMEHHLVKLDQMVTKEEQNGGED